MKAVVQRVKSASVTVDGKLISQIGPGLLCLIGLGEGDGESDIEYITRKILNARLWASDRKAWDVNVQQQGYEVLCVSQFTLHGRLNGNKPDFSRAMGPNEARTMYTALLDRLRSAYDINKVKDGAFGAMMQVELVNDGPVTFILESLKSGDASLASMD
jgi:D-tyrosyl-tRNA(Tyr) deacylase